MTKYSNTDEPDIIGWGVHKDEFKIELIPDFEYRNYEFHKKDIGEEAFNLLISSGKEGKGLWAAFNAVKGKEADKW